MINETINATGLYNNGSGITTQVTQVAQACINCGFDQLPVGYQAVIVFGIIVLYLCIGYMIAKAVDEYSSYVADLSLITFFWPIFGIMGILAWILEMILLPGAIERINDRTLLMASRMDEIERKLKRQVKKK